MAYHGLFIGIDYKRTTSRLAGCIADAYSLRGRETFSGQPQSPGEACVSRILLEEERATKDRIVEAMRAIVARCPRGGDDYFWISYSGHGTFRRGNDQGEIDGNDEAICCYDFQQGGLLWDNEIGVILNGGQGTFFTDCCHSKTMIRSAFDIAPRFIPFDQITEGLAQCEINKLCEPANRDRARSAAIRDSSGAIPGVIHFAGCNDNEFSYDANFNGQPNGAFTYHALQAYRKLPVGTSHQHWMSIVQQQLPDRMNRYPQHPQITATDSDANRVLMGRELFAEPAPDPAPSAKEVAEGVTNRGRKFKLEIDG